MKKDFGVLYELEDVLYVYKACSTLEEAVNIIKNDKGLKQLNPDKVFIAHIDETKDI